MFNRNIVLRKNSINIKRANETPSNCVGKAWPTINIGSTLATLPFKVVSENFPEIIVGIKTMKQMLVLVHAFGDCIEVNGCKVPFLSKVHFGKLIKITSNMD
mgnify:CR=1 FL=1